MRPRTRPRPALLLLALVMVVCGCSLATKGTPLDVRYFSVEKPAITTVQRARSATTWLRLGRVTSGGNLRSRILHRDTEHEILEYEGLRWTEYPEEYARRTLLRALFEDKPLDQAVGGNVPTLDVELVSFEEVRRGAKRAGRVELHYQLHDDHWMIASGVVAVERDAAASDIEPVVAAISAALDDASTQLAGTVAARLVRAP